MEFVKFLKKLAEDSRFSAKYQALGVQGVDAMLKEAEKDGYSVTREEIEALLALLVQLKRGES